MHGRLAGLGTACGSPCAQPVDKLPRRADEPGDTLWVFVVEAVGDPLTCAFQTHSLWTTESRELPPRRVGVGRAAHDRTEPLSDGHAASTNRSTTAMSRRRSVTATATYSRVGSSVGSSDHLDQGGHFLIGETGGVVAIFGTVVGWHAGRRPNFRSNLQSTRTSTRTPSRGNSSHSPSAVCPNQVSRPRLKWHPA